MTVTASPHPVLNPTRPRTDLRWDLRLTARSSIAHGGETRGTITLLRRETVVTGPGTFLQIPIISGNSLRGRLRRIGEELLRDQLGYEGHLTPAAAHALRGGGALAKVSGEPLSGSRLQQVRDLIPHLGIFGAAAGGCIIDGALSVGKVVPHLAETAHITGVASTVSAFEAVQLETYTRVDDSDQHGFATVLPAAALDLDEQGTPQIKAPSASSTSRQMLFQVETFPAGTQFSSWLQLRRPSAIEASFMTEVLQEYTRAATLGGRGAIGHGCVDVHGVQGQGGAAVDPALWRAHARTHHEDALAALKLLT